MLIYEWPNNRKNVLLFLICMAKEKQEVLSKKPNKKLDLQTMKKDIVIKVDLQSLMASLAVTAITKYGMTSSSS